MKTIQTEKPKRCIKFEGYIYLPDVSEKNFEYFVGRMPGRIVIYDEYGKPITNKMKAFWNLGDMTNFVNRAFRSAFQRMKKLEKKKR